jgi:hypothetical protein
MAHVHGAAEAAKSAANGAMAGHAHHAASGAMTGHAHHAAGAAMAGHAHHAAGAMMAKGAAATGAMAAAVSTSHRSTLMSALTKHPLLIFGLGVAAGFLVHKYRREIIGSATRLGEKSKDFVLHQKENLEDLVAEYQECQECAKGGEGQAAEGV